MTDELQQARIEAAVEAICDARPHSGGGTLVIYEDAVDFARAALAVADAHLPSVEEVAEVLYDEFVTRTDLSMDECERAAGAVRALFVEVAV